MEAFTLYKGTTVPLMNDNIDTDQILPKQFLKLIDKKGFGRYLMYEWRYLDNNYTENPDFIFNQTPYKQATILITGDNFGAGSSREHAAWALADYGFKVVIAGSFGDIHYNNELNNGILPIVQPLYVRELLAQLNPEDEVTVDLEEQMIYSPVGEFSFEIDADWKHKLLHGLDDIGITLQYEELITAYEKQRPAYWLEDEKKI
ncbi:3-isopropylmalate dehydratase small subunit [Streptococcus sp. zg-JUN1979]|uniref:3-isopropylmalate dehydratase small subunit n=1 Tax=Streptococcus sp. zg-JUN1979 TaxID=3391450 RepID=UPI0039A76C1F